MNFNNRMKFLVILVLIVPMIVLVEFIKLTKSLGLKFTPYTFFFISLLYFIFSIIYIVKLFK